jgi:hypothetical protein
MKHEVLIRILNQRYASKIMLISKWYYKILYIRMRKEEITFEVAWLMDEQGHDIEIERLKDELKQYFNLNENDYTFK